MMVNIAAAKAKLSELVDAATRGEQVLICNRNQPVAELRAIEPARKTPRDLSPMFPGERFMTEGFFEPLPPEELEQWYGGPVFPAERVAERPAGYSAPPRKPARRKRR